MSSRKKQKNGSRPPGGIAIVGISSLFPKAETLEGYWANIKEGVDAVTEIPQDTHWNPEDYFDADPKRPDMTYARRGAFLSPVDFDPMAFGISPKDIEATDTTQLLGLVAAKQALADAGYGEGGRDFDRNRTSVILGVTGTLELAIPLGARLGHPLWRKALTEAGVDDETAEDVVQRISDGYVDWQENSFPGLLGNVVAGRIANRLDLGGTNCVVDAACASSLSAIHLACLELQSGRSDLALSGGLDTFNDIFMFMCFSKTPALSATGDAKPFSKDGDGTILGEGIGILALKRLEDAERDGDRVYAVIRGLGSSSDGSGNAVYAPMAKGQKKALRRAYEQAGISPGTIELVEAHGTGTIVGDSTEVNALTEVYGDAGREGSWCALGSVKSQIGHTKAAAGAAGIIKAIMALHHKVLPPTIKVSHPVDAAAPGTSPFYVNSDKRPWLPDERHPRRAAVSSFGFGGSNFHCLLEEYGDRKLQPDWDGRVQVLALSAESKPELRKALDGVKGDASWNDLRRLSAKTRETFDPAHECRLLLVVEKDATDLGRLLSAARQQLAGSEAFWMVPEGAFFGSGKAAGGLGILFPGQGSQYAGMLRDLSCQFPEMLEVMAQANEAFATGKNGHARQRLSDYVYPHPAFDNDTRVRQEDELRSTDVAQPAIGAVSLGALNVLERFGVRPDAAAGHSYGELTALCASGCLKSESLHRLSNLRGRLMAEAAKQNGNGTGDGGHETDPGAMLATNASAESVKQLISEQKLDLVIANHNAPDQCVVAGATPSVEKAAVVLEKQSAWVRRLPVAAAFHSPLVEHAREPFAEALKEVRFSKSRLPVFANTTAREYPKTANRIREILANQLVKPVDFVGEIRAMYDAGVRTFLEVGPGRTLTGLVQSILAGEDVHAVALDASRGRRSGVRDLALALAQVSALGFPVEWAAWDEQALEKLPPENQGQRRLTIPIGGANHRLEKPQRPPRKPVPVPSAAPRISAEAAQPRQDPGGLAPSPIPAGSSRPGTPSSQPASAPASAASSSALRETRESMSALIRLQEQTARLHKQFLEGQESAQRTLRALIDQQQGLLQGGTAPSPASQAPRTQPATAPSAPAAPVQGSPAMPEPEAASVPPAESASAPAPDGAADEIASVLLDVVAEKTGYPTDMLELGMGLDSDLGIDSIKRVEIMSALAERLPDAPEIKPSDLGRLDTLQQVAEFLSAGAVTAQPAVPAAAETPAPASAPAEASEGASCAPADEVAATLIEVVAEKTGYPTDMLELSMGLDSDLGIDSIKRVEIMSALAERLPGAPEMKPSDLGRLETLQQVVDFLGAGAADADAASPVRNAPGAGADSDATARTLLEVVSEKTGYPVEMLELDMGLDTDLGIDSIKRVEILSSLQDRLSDAPEVKPNELGSVQTLREIVNVFAGLEKPVAASAQGAATQEPAAPSSEAGTTAPAAEPAKQVLDRQVVSACDLNGSGKEQPVSVSAEGVFWVAGGDAALRAQLEPLLAGKVAEVRRGSLGELLGEDVPGCLSGLLILAPSEKLPPGFLRDAFQLIRKAGAGLKAAAAKGGALLATVSRIDGAFGFGGMNGHSDPVTGGLAGLLKTARHEWPGIQCKALDLDPDFTDAKAAVSALVNELFLGGPVEVGLAASGRTGIRLESLPLNGSEDAPLAEGDVVVVSGGSRGVTAEVALALAQKHRPTLVLLGRSPQPEIEPDWLQSLTGEAEIKRAIHAHAGANGSLQAVEKEFRRRMAAREIRGNMARMQAAGAKVVYRPVDVRDADAVASVVGDVRRAFGPIAGIVHGAGVLADKRIEDKTPEQFDLVYSTKVDGLRALLDAANDDPLKVIVLFSSFTGRHGRVGQIDYAAANEVLNKMAQAEARRRPECRVVSVNWGPWNGGMVTPSLRKVFEAEGVGLIEPRAGAEYLVRELSAPRSEGAPVEIVVLAPSGRAVVPVPAPAPPGESEEEKVVLQREISVAEVPCLESHVLNGKAVVPVALITEWLAHGALHGQPGMHFAGFRNLKVFKGLILENDAAVSIEVVERAVANEDGLLVVPVELRSVSEGKTVRHTRAEVLLSATRPSAPEAPGVMEFREGARQGQEIYASGELFHGPDFQGIEKLEGIGGEGLRALVATAPGPKQWIAKPLRGSWITDPLVLDCAYQLMILWTWNRMDLPSLPTRVGEYRQFQRAFPKDGAVIQIRVTKGARRKAVANIDFLSRDGKLIARMTDYECVADKSLKGAFQQALV